MDHRNQPASHNYPLSALFVVIAACAVGSALLSPVARAAAVGTVGLQGAVAASVGGAVVMTILGAIVGAYHYRRSRGILWGLLTGATLGALFGPLAVAPASALPSLVSVTVGGSLLLVAVGTAFGYMARKEDQ